MAQNLLPEVKGRDQMEAVIIILTPGKQVPTLFEQFQAIRMDSEYAWLRA